MKADSSSGSYSKVSNLRLLTPALHRQVTGVLRQQSSAHTHLHLVLVSRPDPRHTGRLSRHADVSSPRVCLLAIHRRHGVVLSTANETCRVICAYDACVDVPGLCPCASSTNPSTLHTCIMV